LLRLLVQRLTSLQSPGVIGLRFASILLACLNGPLGQIGSPAKVLLALPKTSLRKASHLLHVGRSRRHGVANILASRLIVGSPLLLGLTNALQSGLIDGVGLTLANLCGVNPPHLQVLPSANGLICGPLLGINIANPSLLRRGKASHKGVRIGRIGRKRRLRHILCTGVDGIVSRQNLWRNGDGLSARAPLAATTIKFKMDARRQSPSCAAKTEVFVPAKSEKGITHLLMLRHRIFTSLSAIQKKRPGWLA